MATSKAKIDELIKQGTQIANNGLASLKESEQKEKFLSSLKRYLKAAGEYMNYGWSMAGGGDGKVMGGAYDYIYKAVKGSNGWSLKFVQRAM